VKQQRRLSSEQGESPESGKQATPHNSGDVFKESIYQTDLKGVFLGKGATECDRGVKKFQMGKIEDLLIKPAHQKRGKWLKKRGREKGVLLGGKGFYERREREKIKRIERGPYSRLGRLPPTRVGLGRGGLCGSTANI